MTAATRRRVRVIAAFSLLAGIGLVIAGIWVSGRNAPAEPRSPGIDRVRTEPSSPDDADTAVSSDGEPSAAPSTSVPSTPAPASSRPSDGDIDSFDECAAAGHPIAESYPRQCFADGRSFTEPAGR